MATLSSLLPKPKHTSNSSSSSVMGGSSLSTMGGSSPSTVDTSANAIATTTSTALTINKGPPAYRHRKNWVPRTIQDFGDGGAFPEIHLAQYPLDLGRKKSSATSNTLTLRVDESGEIQYDALVRQGHAPNQIVHSTLKDIIPMDIKENNESMLRPSEDEIQKITDKTKAALEKIVSGKVQAMKPTALNMQTPGAPQYVRYTPNQQGSSAPGETKIIRIAEAQIDPLEPPRFKHKKVPKGPSSPPAPVMHSPPRKITAEEQKQWYIPPCISNWKNARGYAIPLDKRLAADGRGLQEVTINDNFAKFAEALYIADRHAREEVEKRAQMQKKLAQKEKETKEMHLRMLAQKAREERAGFGVAPSASGEQSERSPSRSPAPVSRGRRSPSRENEDDESYRERERLREETRRDIQRKIRMSHMGAETKAKILAREQDRDVSEKIALGQMAPTAGKESIYDQRLFNQTSGIGSGFKDEEAYDLYDKPLFSKTAASSIYRPRNVDPESQAANADAEVEKLMSQDRFVPDRGFKGADTAAPRSGPVQFEKADDPFGIDQFLQEATSGKKHGLDTNGSNFEGEKRRRQD